MHLVTVAARWDVMRFKRLHSIASSVVKSTLASLPPVILEDEMPRIRLFLDNLWHDSEGHLETYRDEVRITLLHELGHYLGLDEDQVAALGLA